MQLKLKCIFCFARNYAAQSINVNIYLRIYEQLLQVCSLFNPFPQAVQA